MSLWLWIVFVNAKCFNNCFIYKYSMPDTSATGEAIVRRSTASTGSDATMGANGQSVLDTLSTRINKGLQDLSAIVIVTARANIDTPVSINTTSGEITVTNINAKLAALTSIGLDGDIVDVIPDDSVDAQKRGEIMQRHDGNVERGVKNWNHFVEGIIKIVRIAADLSGRELPNSFNTAGQIVTIPSRPTA